MTLSFEISALLCQNDENVHFKMIHRNTAITQLFLAKKICSIVLSETTRLMSIYDYIMV